MWWWIEKNGSGGRKRDGRLLVVVEVGWLGFLSQLERDFHAGIECGPFGPNQMCELHYFKLKSMPTQP